MFVGPHVCVCGVRLAVASVLSVQLTALSLAFPFCVVWVHCPAAKLSQGINGILPAEYFDKVVDVKTNAVIFPVGALTASD